MCARVIRRELHGLLQRCRRFIFAFQCAEDGAAQNVERCVAFRVLDRAIDIRERVGGFVQLERGRGGVREQRAIGWSVLDASGEYLKRFVALSLIVKQRAEIDVGGRERRYTREVNLECPRELGINTIMFRDATQLRSELRELGVELQS